MPDSSENQDQTGTANANKSGLDDSQTGAIGDDQHVQPEGQTGNAGQEKLGNEENLPPELEETKRQLLRDWHAKNQTLAEDKRKFESQKEQLDKDSNMLRGLFEQEWFKKAMASEKARREGKLTDVSISDEEFQSLPQNREAFDKYVTAKAKAVAESMYGGQLSETMGALEEIKLKEEFNACAAKFKDFTELNNSGALEPYLTDDRLTYEEAYRLYKYDHSQSNDGERIQQEAEKILSAKRAGSVEKPGTTNPKGSRIIEIKDEDDAFDKAWDEISQGRDVQLVRKTK